MTDNVSIDFSLSNVWRSWRAFRKGKRPSYDIERFEFYLESNLKQLSNELQQGLYRPSHYRTFIVADNKRREISVAGIRDRVVHRLLYDYLVPLYDKTFIYDAWSCRVGKGLTKAIDRTESLLKQYRTSYVWRADVTKFFDSVDHEVLLTQLSHRVSDEKAMKLLTCMVCSYVHLTNEGGGAT